MRDPGPRATPVAHGIRNERLQLLGKVEFELRTVFGRVDRTIRQGFVSGKPIEGVKDRRLRIVLLGDRKRKLERGRDKSEKSIGHSRRLNGSFDVVRDCGGTVITGHIAFRRTFPPPIREPDARSHPRLYTHHDEIGGQ